MCDRPSCPGNPNRVPEEINEENRPIMRAEVTLAGMHILDHSGRMWVDGAQGLVSDMSTRWGFDAVSRIAYMLCMALATLPSPVAEDPEEQVSFNVSERIARYAQGDEVPPEVAAQLMNMGDQVDAAQRELIALAAPNAALGEDGFNERFDTVTDQPNMIQPLLTTLLVRAGLHYAYARQQRNTSALDQFAKACHHNVYEGVARDEQEEIAAMTEAFNLPDADKT